MSTEEIEERSLIIRSKIQTFLICDARQNNPLGIGNRNKYDIVSTNFVMESMTSSIELWKKAMKNVCSLVDEHGILLLTSLIGSSHYRVGERHFPAVSVDASDVVRRLAELGFPRSLMAVRTTAAEADRGYPGMVFIVAHRYRISE